MMTLSLPKERIHEGSLILVNGSYGYSAARQEADHLLPVWEFDSSIRMHQRAAALLRQLLHDIHGQESIIPMSGWRSIQEQQDIWDQTLCEKGSRFTATYVAIPGHSEHHTGLAIDLGLKSDIIDPICPDFPYNGICQVFRQHAASYGFVERYLKGKETVTGIGHEPWHFRYVGVPHAQIMNDHGFVLEEYIAFVKQFQYPGKSCQMKLGKQEWQISYLPADGDKATILQIDQSLPYTISGNNMDGYVITKWSM